MSRQANNSTPSKISFDSSDQGCIQIRMPLTTIPGATNRTVYRVTRRSNGARGFLFRLRVEETLTGGLEPIFFHPAVQGATAQAERFGRLAHIALKALQRFADQDTFNRLQTQFFKILGLPSLGA